MNHRHHLLIDSFAQATLFIFFAFLLNKSTEPNKVVQIFLVFLSFWQFINGVLSYKFFERDSKKLYVKIFGYTFTLISGLFGLSWFLQTIGILNLLAAGFQLNFIRYFWIIIPYYLIIMAVWYLIITFKDIYKMIYRTI
jgi:hypothetical protein